MPERAVKTFCFQVVLGYFIAFILLPQMVVNLTIGVHKHFKSGYALLFKIFLPVDIEQRFFGITLKIPKRAVEIKKYMLVFIQRIKIYVTLSGFIVLSNSRRHSLFPLLQFPAKVKKALFRQTF
jgi:hypothetical protein